ncbi:MAG: LLM class flavin-dependent oxidoreductase, partial [Mesorhizobium sp.]
MPIEFTHVPGKAVNGGFFYDFAETATKLSLIEDAGFRRLVVDDPAGLLTNMDIAAQTLDRTGSLEVVLTHWAGVIEPTVAARQLAALDRRGGGRLS